MSRQLDTDRLVESWLAEGPSRLPDRVIDNIVTHIEQNQQREPFWRPGRQQMNRMMLAVGGVAAAIVLIVGVGMLFGRDNGLLGGQPSPAATPTPAAITTYEAVFIRRDPSTDILVIGVDAAGRERVITRIGTAWSNAPTPDPVGVISPTGLLILPVSGDGPYEVKWTVFDVLDPEATPVVIQGIAKQDTDQLSYSYFQGRTTGRDARASWGPGDQLAIYWYERIPAGDNSLGRNYHLTFADGRTGDAKSIDIADDLSFLPYWALDASGILVDLSPEPRVLRSDGTLADASDVTHEASCRRLTGPGACASPDDVLVARSFGRVDQPTASLTVLATGESFAVVGRFAGWLQSDQ